MIATTIAFAAGLAVGAFIAKRLRRAPRVNRPFKAQPIILDGALWSPSFCDPDAVTTELKIGG